MQIQPITPVIGGEILDIDLTHPDSASQMLVIKAALEKYHVLVFRQQSFTPDSLTAFMSLLGPPCIHPTSPNKITGKPVEQLKDKPLPEGAIEAVYGGKVSANHTANFIEAMKSRKQPISDVWSHNRMLEICHLSNIAMRLGRELKWDPVKREIVGDAQANSFLSRESRKGFETKANV